MQYMTLTMKIQEERKDAKVEGAIEMAKVLNADHNLIIMLLQKMFNFTLEEAEETLNDYESEEQNNII